MWDEQKALEHSSMNTAIVLQDCHSLRLIDVCTYLSHLKKQSFIIMAGCISVKGQGDRKNDLFLYQGKIKKNTKQKTRKNSHIIHIFTVNIVSAI